MGGATPERWIAEAERLTPSGTSGAMSGKGGPRATLHVTVSRTTQYADMHRVLITKQAEPHLLYSFVDDRLGQYFPLDRSARALMGSARTPSGISHNRVGTVNIQIEVVGTTDDWTARPDWRPGPKFRAMHRAIASWGVEPVFIFRPAQTALDRANVVRSMATMTGDAGGGKWWGHCHYPDGETHWDPGRVNLGRFFAAATITTTPPAPIGGLTMSDVSDILAAIAALPAKTAVAVWDAPVQQPSDATKTWTAKTGLWSANTYAWLGSHNKVDLAAITAAVIAALPPSTGDLTADEIQAATEAGVRAVLADAATP